MPNRLTPKFLNSLLFAFTLTCTVADFSLAAQDTEKKPSNNFANTKPQLTPKTTSEVSAAKKSDVKKPNFTPKAQPPVIQATPATPVTPAPPKKVPNFKTPVDTTAIQEAKAKEWYDKGVQLTEKGQFNEARSAFDKAMQITQQVEMIRDIQASQHRLQVQEDALAKAKQELNKARAEKERKRQELKQQAEQKRKQIAKFQADEKERKKNERIAKEKEEKEKQHQEELKKQKEQRDEKERQRLERINKAKDEKDKIKRKTEPLYNEAVDLYRVKKFKEAKAKFLEAQKIIPNFQDVNAYLGRIDQDIVNKQKQDEVEAQKNLEKKQKVDEEFKKKFDEEQKAQALKRQQAIEQQKIIAQKLKKEKEEKLRQEQIERDNQKRKKELHEELVQKSYARALGYYDQKNFLQAREWFKNVEKLEEEYKSTSDYLRKCEQRIAEQEFLQRTGYNTALNLYSAKKYSEAKMKFEEVNSTLRNYKASDKFINEIENNELLTIKRREELKKEALDQQAQIRAKIEGDIKQKIDELERVDEDKRRKELKTQAEVVYVQALKIFRYGKYREAKVKFEQVNSLVPSYKDTDKYLEQIKNRDLTKQKRVLRNKEIDSLLSSNASVNDDPTLTKEQRIEEAKLLADLAEKSSKLYQQIVVIADDKNTIIAKKKLAKVDEVFNSLKVQKERSLQRLRDSEEQQKQNMLKQEQVLLNRQLEDKYNEAIGLLRAKNFDAARSKFLEVESLQPGYKSTRNYLKSIDEGQRISQRSVIADRLKDEDQKVQEGITKHQDNKEEQLRIKELQDKQELVQLAEHAADLNDEILKLTLSKDYLGAKKKFSELEDVMFKLKSLKQSMALDRERELREKSQSKESISVLRDKKALDRSSAKVDVYRKKLQKHEQRQTEIYRSKENTQDRNIVFHEGLELYRARRYTEAKIIFSELAAKGDRQAEGYLDNVDRLIKEQIEKGTLGDARERSEYIAERRRQEHVKQSSDLSEQQRQRELTQEIERQKRKTDQERQQQRRKIETLRMEQRNRDRLESLKKSKETDSNSKSNEYRFRKVQSASSMNEDTDKEDPPAKAFKAVKLPPKGTSPSEINLKEKAAKEQQLERQKSRSEEVKNYKKDAELKKIQQENDFRKLKTENNKREEQRLTREKEFRLSRENKIKNFELEKAVKERQAKLEAERRVIFEQLNKGVEVMYSEAVKLYKAGNYQASAAFFSDINDLIPNYKKTNDYLKKTENHLQNRPFLNVQNIPQKSSHPQRESQVSKTLDLFDSAH